MTKVRLNGQQAAAANVDRFTAWVAERDAAGDWSDYVRSNRLNRTEVAAECGFAKSVLQQNPAVRELLDRLEARLVSGGTLTPREGPKSGLQGANADEAGVGVPDGLQAAQIALRRAMAAKSRAEQRVKALEEQNATLRAEARELRDRLRQFGFIEEHLARTGRLLTP